jgi:hypothetical protein
MKLSHLVPIGWMTCGALMAQNATLLNGSWQQSGISLTPASSPAFGSLILLVTGPKTPADISLARCTHIPSSLGIRLR